MPRFRPNTIKFDDKELLLTTSGEMDGNKPCDKTNQTAYIPESILKPTLTNIPSSSKPKSIKNVSSGSGVKPNAILSLEDRDIVVIDHVDYKESCKESEVIVVEKPRLPPQNDIDLADLLGQNWPSIAGESALALNNNKATGSGHYNVSSNDYSMPLSSVPNTTSERNKSKNPLSHFGQSKVKRTNYHSNSSNLINLDSDGGVSNSEIGPAKKSENVYHNFDVSAKKSFHPPPPPPAISQSAKSDYLSKLGLDVGSMSEISRENCDSAYGVIRWIGFLPSTKILTVGVELEDEQVQPSPDMNDGSINGVRLFKCPAGRALFVSPEQCSIDRRFQDVKATTANGSSSDNEKEKQATESFGQIVCPIIQGSVPPLKIVKLTDLEGVTGKFKGVQGHYNSCYLDATLFAMFTFTCVFDSLLFRPPDEDDIESYKEVQTVLREEIVNPLRKNLFVRADRVMKLRELLEKLSSVTGLTCEEKDPEEFLNSLLAQIMKAEPFLKLNSGQDAFYYQLFVEKDERLSFPSVQQLFEQSFLASDIKLKEVPSCLIIQMPRFGKNFKMYPRILPSQILDVTDIIEGSPRQCCVCGKLAELECKECFGSLQFGAGLESTSFCKLCLDKVHSHDKRTNHTPRELQVPQDFLCMAEHLTVPRIFMELFAVVCIETSHYVAFVKSGSGMDAPWCFFDSMADRKGEQNGYNIPEMVSVPNLPLWLSEEGSKELNERYLNDKSLPEHAKRLMCDAYMCMYQTDVMMYR